MHTQPNQTLVNRNISITNPTTGENHRTSIRLEKIEWTALQRICDQKNISINEFCGFVDQDGRRQEHSRTSRIRSAILHHYLDEAVTLDS
jgi:predicted DNA-binding ribbon-helix-helix protein